MIASNSTKTPRSKSKAKSNGAKPKPKRKPNIIECDGLVIRDGKGKVRIAIGVGQTKRGEEASIFLFGSNGEQSQDQIRMIAGDGLSFVNVEDGSGQVSVSTMGTGGHIDVSKKSDGDRESAVRIGAGSFQMEADSPHFDVETRDGGKLFSLDHWRGSEADFYRVAIIEPDAGEWKPKSVWSFPKSGTVVEVLEEDYSEFGDADACTMGFNKRALEDEIDGRWAVVIPPGAKVKTGAQVGPRFMAYTA